MWVYFFFLWLAVRPYLTQKSNTLSESVNYEMGEWSRSALMNSWCYTITNGVRGISLSRRIFHNTPAPLSNASLVAKETPVGGRQRPLSFLSFFSRRDSHLLAGKKRQNYGNEEIESNRFNKQKKKKERKNTLNVQHTFRGRFRCRNRNDWGCQTWSEQQCHRRIA